MQIEQAEYKKSVAKDYNSLPADYIIDKTVVALQDNGFHVQVAPDFESAKEAVLRLLPKGAEVFTATSKTLEAIGLKEIIDESGRYDSVRKKLLALAGDPNKEKARKQLGSTPDYVIGSAHALTEDGKIMVASGTGSQLAAEVYGANHVIYVVGAQKIVRDIENGINRIEQHIMPLESERLQDVYNDKNAQTNFSRLFIYNRDAKRDVQVIVVKQNVGF